MKLIEKVDPELRELLSEPVAVLGYGSSGKAVADLLKKIGTEVICYDEILVEESEYIFQDAERFKLVIFSAALAHDHRWIVAAEKAGCRCLSEMEFAARFRSSPTFIVTGTNGKTTLAEFIVFALKRQGVAAMAAGDNHAPLSRLAIHPDRDGTIAVCEISPIHARRLNNFSSEVIFWTNFYEDHLDIFPDLEAVFAAHWRLVEMNPEAPVYAGPSAIEAIRRWKPESSSRLCEVDPTVVRSWDLPSNSAFETTLHRDALAPLYHWWIDRGLTEVSLKTAAENFETRAHRLYLSMRLGFVEFWNDSKSSNFAATLAALENFNEPVIWIGGGALKRGNLEGFADSLKGRLAHAILLGSGGEALYPLLEARAIPAIQVRSVGEAVKKAHELCAGRGQIVFSPGHSAKDMFKSYVERGISFENSVIGLKHGSLNE